MNTQNNQEEKQHGRMRRRVRGMLDSPTGRAVKYSSLVAPVVGLIVNDLRKPNSLSRQLLGRAVNKLLERKYDKVAAIDITDKVEITDGDDNKELNH